MQAIESLPISLIAGVVFVAVLAIALVMGRFSGSSRAGVHIEKYINAGGSPKLQIENEATLRATTTSPLGRVLAYAAVLSPEKLRITASADLARARVNMRPDVYIGIRAVVLIAFPAIGVLTLIASPQKGTLQWVIAAALTFVGLRLPTIWLQRRIKRNSQTIERALPFALDLLVACLDGGLSLEAALDRVASETDSLLSQELQLTLAEIALGRPSADALRDLATRTGVTDLKRLTETVLQAERMGFSIAEAMGTLADESRTKRRQRAEEAAQKAPLKMLPVMVCTTLPAIGAIVLTPAMINFTRSISVFAHH
jgi:tight adherence protein C